MKRTRLTMPGMTMMKRGRSFKYPANRVPPWAWERLLAARARCTIIYKQGQQKWTGYSVITLLGTYDHACTFFKKNSNRNNSYTAWKSLTSYMPLSACSLSVDNVCEGVRGWGVRGWGGEGVRGEGVRGWGVEGAREWGGEGVKGLGRWRGGEGVRGRGDEGMRGRGGEGVRGWRGEGVRGLGRWRGGEGAREQGGEGGYRLTFTWSAHQYQMDAGVWPRRKAGHGRSEVTGSRSSIQASSRGKPHVLLPS